MAALLLLLYAVPRAAINLPMPLSRSELASYREAAVACSAVVLEPRNSQAWRRLGLMLHGKGRLDAARSALQRGCELDAQDAQALVELANVERALGCFDEASHALLAAEKITGRRDQSLCYYRAPTSPEAAAPLPSPDAAPASVVHGAAGQVWVTQIATAEECAWVIATAERFNEARGGWGNPPPRYAPAGTVADNVRAPHMLVADCGPLTDWLNAKLEAVVWPLLSRQFGEGVAAEAWLYDSFLLKFDGLPGRSGLGLHVDDDGLGISVNLLLSDPADFEGGGTFFDEDGETFTLAPRQGELVSHHGGLRHASVPTTSGVRYILVAFLRSPPLTIDPPEGVTGFCPNSQAAAAAVRRRSPVAA